MNRPRLQIATVLVGLALCLCAISGFATLRHSEPPRVAAQGPVLDNRPPPPCPTERLLSYWAMGGQGNVPMHSWILRKGISWQEWVDDWLRPELDKGYRRVMIHLPFGRLPADGYMSFDAYIHAQNLDLDHATKGFAKALRRVVRGNYTDGEPVQVICYLGSLKLDPDFVLLRGDERRRGDWLWRAWRSVQPVLKAECEIAFDTGAIFKPDDPAYGFALTVRNLGAGAWMEGTEFGYVWHPQPYDYSQQELEFHEHLAGFPVAVNHQHYWNNIADVEHDGWRPAEGHRWAQVAPGQDVILLLDGHSAPRNEDGTKKTLREIFDTAPEWMPPMIERDVRAGFSVAVSASMSVLHESTDTPEELLGCKR